MRASGIAGGATASRELENFGSVDSPHFALEKLFRAEVTGGVIRAVDLRQ